MELNLKDGKVLKKVTNLATQIVRRFDDKIMIRRNNENTLLIPHRGN